MMPRLKSILLLGTLLIGYGGSFAQPAKQSDTFTQLPPELSAVDWTRTPDDVLAGPKKDEPLVWVGQVTEVLAYQKGSKIEINWLCKHLKFVDAGPTAIAKRPIKVTNGAGLFGVSLVVEDMSMEQAMKFKAEHTRIPHYLLAGGTFSSVLDRQGSKIPFLQTSRMAMGPKLVEFTSSER
jgi:hypothetical protein